SVYWMLVVVLDTGSRCCAGNTQKCSTPGWTTALSSWKLPKNGTAANPVYGKDYADNPSYPWNLCKQTWLKRSYPRKARTLSGLIWPCIGIPNPTGFSRNGAVYSYLRAY